MSSEIAAIHLSNSRTALNLLNQVKQILPKFVFQTTAQLDLLTIRADAKNIRFLALFLRNSSAYQAASLIELAVVDTLRRTGRFSVKYNFLSAFYNSRCIIEVFCDEVTPLPSLTTPFFNHQKLFASAGWLEREVWDLFGIYFNEHGDLRRILTDYGFAGHPLRKDFPLTGFHEVVYNDAEGRIVTEPVELAQEFRVFHIN